MKKFFVNTVKSMKESLDPTYNWVKASVPQSILKERKYKEDDLGFYGLDDSVIDWLENNIEGKYECLWEGFGSYGQIVGIKFECVSDANAYERAFL